MKPSANSTSLSSNMMRMNNIHQHGLMMVIIPKTKPNSYHIRDAVTFRATNTNITTMQCLHAAGGYSDDEFCNKTLQMAVNWLYRNEKPDQSTSIITGKANFNEWKDVMNSTRPELKVLLKWYRVPKPGKER